MIAEFARVVLTRDVPDDGLRAGDVGFVVEALGGGEAYFVDVQNEAGDTVAVAYVPADGLRPLTGDDVRGARARAAE